MTAVLSPNHHHQPKSYPFEMSALTSAAGLVGFLSEPDPALRSFALQRLNEDIDLLWPEVAGSVGQM
jgi:26S proteasome regulatory subunit N2